MTNLTVKAASLSVAVAAACVIGALAASSAEAQSCVPESRFDAIQKRGKLLAGVRYDYPPGGYVDKDGKNIGYGPDVAREFAKRLGVQIEFIQTTSKNRFPLLISGAIDADIGVTTPEKPRQEVVDFSYSYVLDRSTIVVREGMSKNPEDYYKNEKVVVGAIQGSNFVQLWKDRAPNANMKLYQEYPELMIALAQGKVDLMVVSEITGLDLMEKLGDRAKGLVMGIPFLYDPQAISLPQNDSKWHNWVNWALQRMWAEGTLQKLYKQHYKVDAPFFPWENGQLQPRVLEVGDAKFDMWKK